MKDDLFGFNYRERLAAFDTSTAKQVINITIRIASGVLDMAVMNFLKIFRSYSYIWDHPLRFPSETVWPQRFMDSFLFIRNTKSVEQLAHCTGSIGYFEQELT